MNGLCKGTPTFHGVAVDDSIIDRETAQDLFLSRLSSFWDCSNTNILNHPRLKVNLIITDYSMPAFTGYDLIRRIKGSEMLKDIPAVIMSSENIRKHLLGARGSRVFPESQFNNLMSIS